jgi:hypothetical protein
MMIDKIKDEPVLVVAAVQALLGLLLAFGVGLSEQQVAAILTATGALLAFVARSKVTPTRHV